jgi:hypothetical protein
MGFLGRTGLSAARRSFAHMHAHPGDHAVWEPLRRQVAALAPRLSAPPPATAMSGPRLCASCRGPSRPGGSRCYQCALHAECLSGLLPDVVVPVAYAAKGGEHARNLWLYKSGGPGAAAAAGALRALLVVFLHDHGGCAWRSAGMAGPTHVAVVPSGRGRPGRHPLWSLVGDYLAMPSAALSLRSRDDQQTRDFDPERFSAQRLPGARVVLLDDTWTSGASAVSATAALRLAGARAVAVIVLGRHLTAPDVQPDGAAFAPSAMPFRPGFCAVHEPAGQPAIG